MTYKEFLTDFRDEMAEAFRDCEIPGNERNYIIYMLGRKIGTRSLDGADILSMFQDVCQSFSPHTLGNDQLLKARLRYAGETYLDGRQEAMINADPMISYESIEERGAMLK